MAQTEAVQVMESTQEGEYQDRPIKCVDCNENFIWTAGEQVFFHDKGLKNEPKRCKPCKQAKNERLAAIAAAQSSGVRQRIEVQCSAHNVDSRPPSRFIHPRDAPSTVARASCQEKLQTRKSHSYKRLSPILKQSTHFCQLLLTQPNRVQSSANMHDRTSIRVLFCLA